MQLKRAMLTWHQGLIWSCGRWGGDVEVTSRCPGWREHSHVGFKALVRERKSLPDWHLFLILTSWFGAQRDRRRLMSASSVGITHKSNIIILIKGCAAIKTATMSSSHHWSIYVIVRWGAVELHDVILFCHLLVPPISSAPQVSLFLKQPGFCSSSQGFRGESCNFKRRQQHLFLSNTYNWGFLLSFCISLCTFPPLF